MGIDKIEKEIKNCQEEIGRLQLSINAENEIFRSDLEEKSKKIAEMCKPLEDERKSILAQMEELDESFKKVDVKIKTQTATKKRERMDQIQRAKSTEKKSMENLKMLQKKKNDLDKKIEGMNKRNSKLRNDIERVSHEK